MNGGYNQGGPPPGVWHPQQAAPQQAQPPQAQPPLPLQAQPMQPVQQAQQAQPMQQLYSAPPPQQQQQQQQAYQYPGAAAPGATAAAAAAPAAAPQQYYQPPQQQQPAAADQRHVAFDPTPTYAPPAPSRHVAFDPTPTYAPAPVPPAVDPAAKHVTFAPPPSSQQNWTPPVQTPAPAPAPAPAPPQQQQQQQQQHWQPPPPAASASPPQQQHWQPPPPASSAASAPPANPPGESWQPPAQQAGWGRGVTPATVEPPAVAQTPAAAPAAPAPAVPAVLNMFDPFAAPPKPVEMPALDAASVTRRCAELHQRGALSAAEYQALSNKAYLLPAKITLALDKLEAGDRAGVFELVMNSGAGGHGAPQAQGWGSPAGGAGASGAATGAGRSNPFDAAAAMSEWNAVGASSTSTSTSTSGAAAAAKASGDSDDSDCDSDSDEGNTVMEDDEAMARRLQEQFDAEDSSMLPPHPAAGGLREPLPPAFVMVDGALMGQILTRVSSKKLFRKWKQMFFVLTKDRVCMYDSAQDYQRKRSPRIVYRMHSCMYVKKPEAKQTYSVMDESRQIYYTTFRENITEEGGSSGYTGVRSTQNKYSFDAPSERICKFGSERPSEITAFAYALHGVVQGKRREKLQMMQLQKMHGGEPSAGRYN